MNHDSDCATNNTGVPELLGSCDCSAGEGVAPRLLGLVEKLERKAARRALTKARSKDYLRVDSEYRGARADLLNAIKVLSK